MAEQPPYNPNDPLLQQLMIQYLMGAPGVAPQFGIPSFNMGQMQGMYGMIPQDQEALDFSRDSANYLQDVTDLQADPMVWMNAGVGALSPDALEPAVSYEVVDQPGLRAMMAYLARPDTFEGLVATEILQNGGTATSAIGRMKQTLADAEASGNESPEVELLRLSLPTYENEVTGEQVINWQEALDTAQAMQQTYLEDPQPGSSGAVYDDQGQMVSQGGERIMMYDEAGNPQLVEVRTEESPMAQWLRENGLSSPYEEYGVEDFMSEDWTRGVAQWQQDAAGVQEAFDQLSEARQGLEDFNAIGMPGPMVGNPNSAATFGADAMRQAGLPMPQGRGQFPQMPTSAPGSEQAMQEYAIRRALGLPTSPVPGQQSQIPGAQGQAWSDPYLEAAPFQEQSPGLTTSQILALPQGAPPSQQQMSEQQMNDFWGGLIGAAVAPQGRSLDDETSRQEAYRAVVRIPEPPMGPTSPPASEQALQAERTAMIQRALGLPTSPVPGRDMSAQDDWLTDVITGGGGAGRYPQARTIRKPRRGDEDQRDVSVRRGRTRTPEEAARFAQERRVGQAQRNYDTTREANWAQAEDLFGADFGAAMAMAHYAQQSGITPFQQQMMARRMAPIAMGLNPQGYLPGM